MGRPVTSIFKDPAKLEEAKSLAQAGYSIAIIAERLGTTVSMVTNTFYRKGIKTNWSLNKKDGGNRPTIGLDPLSNYNTPLSEEEADEVEALVRIGMSYGEIHEKLGHSVPRIRGVIKRRGLQSHGSKVYLGNIERNRRWRR